MTGFEKKSILLKEKFLANVRHTASKDDISPQRTQHRRKDNYFKTKAGSYVR